VCVGSFSFELPKGPKENLTPVLKFFGIQNARLQTPNGGSRKMHQDELHDLALDVAKRILYGVPNERYELGVTAPGENTRILPKEVF
jgi:hypothetical protein